jgi:type IV pilus assembly protein PilB
MQTSRLGDILVKNNIITSEQLTVALQEQKMSGGQSKLGSILVKHGLVKEPDLVRFFRASMVCQPSFADYDIDPAVIKIIPAEVVQKYNLVPVNRAGSTLIVAVSDPSNLFAIEDIKFMTSYNVEMVVTSESDIRGAIDKYYDQSASLADVMDNLDMEDLELVDTEEEVDVSSLEKATEDAPVVKLVNLILMDAIKKKSQ